jgi:hypothetical protein
VRQRPAETRSPDDFLVLRIFWYKKERIKKPRAFIYYPPSSMGPSIFIELIAAARVSSHGLKIAVRLCAVFTEILERAQMAELIANSSRRMETGWPIKPYCRRRR